MLVKFIRINAQRDNIYDYTCTMHLLDNGFIFRKFVESFIKNDSNNLYQTYLYQHEEEEAKRKKEEEERKKKEEMERKKRVERGLETESEQGDVEEGRVPVCYTRDVEEGRIPVCYTCDFKVDIFEKTLDFKYIP